MKLVIIILYHLVNVNKVNLCFYCEIYSLNGTFHCRSPPVTCGRHHALSPLFPVSYGGQGGALQESGGVFLSCLQTTLAQHGALVFHPWVVKLLGKHNRLCHYVIVFGLTEHVFSCAVPGFGPNPFGGPPGHMGPMQPGKNQVDFLSR